MKNKNLKEYKKYWPDGRLYRHYFIDENNLFQKLWKEYYFDKLDYIDYCMDGQEEGERIKYYYENEK
jgi:hypothetical protein